MSLLDSQPVEPFWNWRAALYAILGAVSAYAAQKYFAPLDFPVSLAGDFLKLLIAVAVGDLLMRHRRNVLYLLVPVFPLGVLSALYQQHRVFLPDTWAVAIENPTAYLLIIILGLLLALLLAGTVINRALQREAIPIRTMLTTTMLLFGIGAIAANLLPPRFADQVDQLNWLDVGYTAYFAAAIGRRQ